MTWEACCGEWENGNGVVVDTYFASPERMDGDALARTIATVSGDPLMNKLLELAGGIMAVVNEQRQIVAVNDSFLTELGIEEPAGLLGLRPGEVVGCHHAGKEPAGCGTTPWCRSCGAAIAMVTSLSTGKPESRLCAIPTTRNGQEANLALHVRAQPFEIGDQRFLLLFLRDVSKQQHQAEIERIFFHDINNMLCMLVGASDLLVHEHPSELAQAIRRASARLSREVAIQRCLSEQGDARYEPTWETLDMEELFEELEPFFANHPAARNRRLDLNVPHPQQLLHTDRCLLLRILQNMILNALEATDEHGEVRVWTERTERTATFLVWNSQHIPPDVALRIFQRHFSTKSLQGRGIGTYAMKLLGEEYLDGRVSFTSSPETGTVFRFELPLVWRGAPGANGFG